MGTGEARKGTGLVGIEFETRADGYRNALSVVLNERCYDARYFSCP